MTMRLIDYTVAKEGSADDAATNTCYDCLTRGINGSKDEGGHLLKFMFNRPDVSRTTGRLKNIMASPLNTYTPPTTGFRYSTAKTDGGYPIVRDPASGLTESVRYLFDDSAQNGKKIVDRNVSPTMFTQDAASGNYVFDSDHTSAVYDKAAHTMDAVEHSDGGWRFWPFDEISKTVKTTTGVNHYFGVQISSALSSGPNNTNGHGGDLVLDFTGDDDMWIVVDGALIASTSGSLDRKHAVVNFTTGAIDQQSYHTDNTEHSTVKARFQEAGITPAGGFSGDTFAPNSTHTLNVFYLERGNYSSNMRLETSLVPRYPLYYDMNGGTGGPKQRNQ